MRREHYGKVLFIDTSKKTTAKESQSEFQNVFLIVLPSVSAELDRSSNIQHVM